MSFIERLCKIEKKQPLKGGYQKQKSDKSKFVVKLDEKHEKKHDQFQQNHSDLKDMLKLLQGGKNQSQETILQRNASTGKDRLNEPKKLKAVQCRKQNISNKIQFPHNNADTKIGKSYLNYQNKTEQNNESQADRYSFLINNLRCTGQSKNKLTLNNNPESAPEQVQQQKLEINSIKFGSTCFADKKGLENIGNTCYMNAVLQCLFHLGTFSEGLKKDLDSSCSEYINKSVIKKYVELYEGVYKNNSKFKDLSTLPLKKSVSKICSMFIDFQQEDAHQFLSQLLDTMHSEVNRVDEAPKYKSISIDADSNLPTIVQEYRKFYKRYDDSYIYDNFCGQFLSFVTCSNCKYESKTLQNYLGISLPMSRGLQSLQELIQDYFQEEALWDYYSCQSCLKSSRNSLKKLDLWNPPNCFVIHLKRSQFGKKNVDAIKIPTRNLNMKKFMKFRNDKIQKSGVYRLQGIVQHMGVIDGGHYWALVRDSHSWYKIDDTIVTKRSAQDVEQELQKRGSDTAYLLFYEII